jgi:hypothetical protein
MQDKFRDALSALVVGSSVSYCVLIGPALAGLAVILAILLSPALAANRVLALLWR